MKRTLLIDIIAFLLILLFVYTAASKLMDFGHFQGQMHNQTLPSWLADVMIWTLPEMELVVAGLLIFPSTRLFGLYASLVLMVLFTAYIGLVLLHVFQPGALFLWRGIEDYGLEGSFPFQCFFLAVELYRNSSHEQGKEGWR